MRDSVREDDPADGPKAAAVAKAAELSEDCRSSGLNRAPMRREVSEAFARPSLLRRRWSKGIAPSAQSAGSQGHESPWEGAQQTPPVKPGACMKSCLVPR
jgi:hypothetical protein